MTRLQIFLLYYGCVSVYFGESVKAASNVPEYCVKGPEVWCHNFTTAIECQTTKYCLEVFWLADKPTSHGSCGSCETEIQKIRQTFDRGSQNFNISELSEDICNSTFESQLLRFGCLNSLNQYARYHFEEWLSFLKSNVHPATVCRVVGVCSEIKSDSSSNNSVVVGSQDVLPILTNFTRAVESAKPLATQRCTWNSYMCKNLASSRKCHSTSLCIRHIWSKLQYPKDDDPVCLGCENMVQQAHKKLQNNESPKELRRVREASCRQIFIKEALQECRRLTDDFLPELSEMLASQMNPTAICTVASLCNNARIDSLLRAADGPVSTRMPINPKNGSELAPVRDNTLCFVCQYLLHFIQEELEKPEEQQKIEKAMNRTCKLAPRSMRTECRSFVFEYGALMISLFSQKIDPSLICPAMKICPQRVSAKERCRLCLTLMENTTATLDSNRNKVSQVLSSLMMAGDVTVDVVELSYIHQQDLIDLMSSQFNPSQKCELLRFCDPKTLASQQIP